MKEERVLNVLGQVDPQYISESAPAFQAKKKHPAWIKWGAMAACVCLCVFGAFQLLNPGMGKTADVHHIAAVGEDLYYSVWDKGAYAYDRDTAKITKLSANGLFYETPSGLILYDSAKNEIYRVNENESTLLGTSDIKSVLNDALTSNLLDVRNGFAYWLGEAPGNSIDHVSYLLVRTPLAGGNAETLFVFSDEMIPEAILRGDKLYCYSRVYHGTNSSASSSPDRIYSLDLNTGDKETLFTYGTQNDSVFNDAHFTPDAIVIQTPDALFTLDYEGGEASLLSQQTPSSNAFDYHNGSVYFYTDFPDGEFCRSSFASVNLATKEINELVRITGDNGCSPYTYIEVAVCDDGYYFTDPQKGLFYHSFTDGTDTQIVKG